MPLSRVVNNIGVGKVEATFLNLTTTSLTWKAGTALPFTVARFDSLYNAASIVNENEVAYVDTTAALLGAVVALSEDLNGNSFPERAVVQVAGVAEMQGTTGGGAPAVGGQGKAVQWNGCVAQQSTTLTNLMLQSRGVIINVHSGDRVDVLF